MASSRSRMITDHQEIRRWAEERGAKPACVRGTGGGDDAGIVRLDFPGYSGADSLEHIGWDEWFDKFERSNLALLVQDTTAGGEKSNFNKLVSRTGASRGGSRSRTRNRRATTTARSRSRKRTAGSRSRRKTSASRGRSSRSRSRAASGRSRSSKAERSSRSNASSRYKRSSSRSSSSKRNKGGTRKITLTIPKDVRIEAKGGNRRGRRAA